MTDMKWISVKDKLPEKKDGSNFSDLVLVYQKSYPSSAFEYVVYYYRFEQKDWCTDLVGDRTFSDEKITHWMPLPEPPNQDGK